ncbi:MAG: Si-specific NAD(P)(+) transhydrogenase [Myxococcales bacterium]|nr:Si-specific NAD(P)(+) transhydrogenase [Myxococcales bacterium]
MNTYDVAVIGSGPAGQKAAIAAAKNGLSVAMIERERLIGGACVHRGTIPSKTLRETALQLASVQGFRDVMTIEMSPHVEVATLMARLDEVTGSHAQFMSDQLLRNKVEIITGRASFVSANELSVSQVRGAALRITAATIIIATGSRPRQPPEIPVDHEHLLDSDSILSMIYLPKSLTVLGAGVIASEYASIFAALGTEVTIIDKGHTPVSFMDPELSAAFVSDFEVDGGRYLPKQEITECHWDGESAVVTALASGEVVRSEKLLCALGRLANVEGLNLQAAGVEQTKRGHIEVNEHCQTSTASIYAVGDVIGHPALASTSMEQGRRAMCHAMGLPQGREASYIPIGIYSIPEMSSVGLTEAAATEQFGACTVGRAHFSEVARGQISGGHRGLLKLVADEAGETLLGAHIVGNGACELVHVAQVALISGWSVESFVENIFNFPTLAEAYRIAALDLINRGRAQVVRDTSEDKALAG